MPRTRLSLSIQSDQFLQVGNEAPDSMGGGSGHHCPTSSRMAPSLACLPPWNRSPFFTTALAKTKLSNVSNVSTFPNGQPMLKSTQLNQAKQCIVASCQQCTAVANHNVRHNVRPMRSMQQPTSRPGICQHFKFQHTLAHGQRSGAFGAELRYQCGLPTLVALRPSAGAHSTTKAAFSSATA